MAVELSSRRIQLNKSKSLIFGVVVGATVITIFSAFAFKALIDQGKYQNRVLKEKKLAVKQLEENVTNAKKLVEKFQEFDAKDPNFLGGEKDGLPSTANPGSNPKLVLDSLPSKYDYPALATSIEKLMNSRAILITEIKGVDDIVNNPDVSRAQTDKIAMGFSLSGKSTYEQVQLLVGDLENSIRPFLIDTLELSAEDETIIKVSINGNSYYQPSKSLDLDTTKVVK